MGNIFVVRCPERNFVYKTADFISTGNEGIADYGTNEYISIVSPMVEREDTGKIAIVKKDNKQVQFLYTN